MHALRNGNRGRYRSAELPYPTETEVNPMKDTEAAIHVAEPIGDGQGRVDTDEIDTDDVTVTVTQPFGSPDNRGNQVKETVWLDNDVIESHTAIHEPTGEEQTYDAVLTIVGAPVPDGFDANEDLSIEISITQVRQAKAAECPSCGNDLRETFKNGGCSICGFYFDGDDLCDDRRAELNQLQDDYTA